MSLKRELGLFELTLYGVGMIVGAGIYVLIGKVAGLAGYGIWLSFLLSSFLAIFTGLSYAELSSIFTKDSAEFDYVKNSTGSMFLATLVGWFMLGSLIISGTTVALGLAGYLSSLINFPHTVFLAILSILLFTWINYKGISLSAKINDVSTILEVSGLLIIIFGGLFLISTHNVPLSNYTDFPVTGVISGAILAFFAYIGFGSIAKMGEEAKNPERNIPLAIILSIIITTLLYVGVAFSAVTLVNPEKLSASPDPASIVAGSIHPGLSTLISIIALFSTGNTVLLILITSSRMLYGLSKQNVFPKFLSKVHRKTKTPYISIFIVSLIAMLLTFIKDIKTVAEVTNLWTFITYFFVNLSVILLRYKRKRIKFKAPINIGNFPLFALIGLIFSVLMIGYYFYDIGFSFYHPSIWLTLLLLFLLALYFLSRKK